MEPASRREKSMRFEIFRLDENGTAVGDSQIAEAEAVRSIVEHAAATGDRVYIRPLGNATV
ncbi:hypothetical protein [Streptacidiphilus anmyonensis]|uniref:hypothetical protein n=1 Tax=Streptacidiphilus anmyonensis TaxID=405782 RepID=UPI00128D57EA|nr:hypothetical protein [Streptacidiphilus anmyonensis]